MSEHTAGNNPVAAGTKIKSTWMEYVEDCLDDNGSLTPCLKAGTIAAGDVAIPSEVTTTIPFSEVLVNNLSGWNSTTHVFTAPSNGVYLAILNVNVGVSAGASKSAEVSITASSGAASAGHAAISSQILSQSNAQTYKVTGIFVLLATETLTPTIIQHDTVAINFSVQGSDYGYLHVVKLGRLEL